MSLFDYLIVGAGLTGSILACRAKKLVTFGFYKLMKIQQFGGDLDEKGQRQGTALWHFFLRLGERSHIEKGSMWKWISRLMDRHC